ncbi:AaceriAGR362Cp [[Ashbya] aceris (nom. inval.)]|nr:AaceriAGR362Cp [[Ashbya] aceris (nom. inval.)]
MSTLNVLRYTALGLGVVAGVKNDWSLQSEAKHKQKAEEQAKQLKLVAEAKAEYAKLQSKSSGVASTAQFDLEDPNMDFGAAIEGAVAALQ